MQRDLHPSKLCSRAIYDAVCCIIYAVFYNDISNQKYSSFPPKIRD